MVLMITYLKRTGVVFGVRGLLNRPMATRSIVDGVQHCGMLKHYSSEIH